MTCRGTIDTPPFRASRPKGAQARRDLARIHILAKQAGLIQGKDKSAYRRMLCEVGGVASSTALDAAGRGAVIRHLLGQIKGPAYPGRPKNCDGRPQLRKIEALLADNGLPWSYADGIARQMYDKDRVAFCDSVELAAIITALIKHIRDL